MVSSLVKTPPKVIVTRPVRSEKSPKDRRKNRRLVKRINVDRDLVQRWGYRRASRLHTAHLNCGSVARSHFVARQNRVSALPINHVVSVNVHGNVAGWDRFTAWASSKHTGMAGQVRLRYRPNGSSEWTMTEWLDVDAERDYTRQLTIPYLKPGTAYEIECGVEKGIRIRCDASRCISHSTLARSIPACCFHGVDRTSVQ